jgi:HAD superfamily hydrolase (TIGR01450 family)
MKILESFLSWYDDQADRPEAMVLDIDGVLILNRHALPGAHDLIDRLRSDRTPYSLLTNAADDSVEERIEVLSSAGLDLDADKVTSSGHPLEDLAEKRAYRGELFFMVARLGEPCYAKAAGIEITREVADLDRCRGVILGEGPSDWRLELNAIINFFRSNPDAPLICPNPDPYFPGPGGTIVISSGGIARFIVHLLDECGIRIVPDYLGKPYAPIFDHNHRRMEVSAGKPLDPRHILMVGDMLEGDILGGNRFGYRTALLLTGGTTVPMLERSSTRPDLVFERL